MGMFYLPFHAFGVKESVDCLKQLLQYIKYDTYTWNICADLKVIALLLGQQLGYTKFPCLLCEWDSRDKARHYVKSIWPLSKFSSGLLSGELWFCKWRAWWTFPPGHCSNGGQITKGNGAHHQFLLIIPGPWCVILQIRRSFGRRRRSDCTRTIRNLWLMT